MLLRLTPRISVSPVFSRGLVSIYVVASQLFKKDAGTSYFLIDEQDEVECFADLNGLIEELRQLGIKGAEIHL